MTRSDARSRSRENRDWCAAWGVSSAAPAGSGDGFPRASCDTAAMGLASGARRGTPFLAVPASSGANAFNAASASSTDITGRGGKSIRPGGGALPKLLRVWSGSRGVYMLGIAWGLRLRPMAGRILRVLKAGARGSELPIRVLQWS